MQKVSADTLEYLASECQLKELEVGAVLFQDGEEGNSMYVILSGELVVSKNGTEIARREKGDYLGEVALIESKPRSATVITAVPTFVVGNIEGTVPNQIVCESGCLDGHYENAFQSGERKFENF